MSHLLAKLQPWGRAERKIVMGSNQAVLRWAEQVRAHHDLTASCFDVLRVVATHMGAEAWDDMRLCIAWITERVSWSRRTVERALRYLKDNFLLRQDGEIPVKKGRPVVRYRLGSTPECPLPWNVVEARETAAQGGNGVYTSSTGPSVLVEDQGDTPEENFMHPTAGVSHYRSAKPIKTGPQAGPVGARGVRRPTHLRWLRSFAAALVERRGTPVPTGTRQVSQDGSCGFVGASSGVAVTYCHPPTKGAAVNPFTDPALGALPLAQRYLYLGLLELHSKCGDRTPNDAFFLKAEVFRYDEGISHQHVQLMVEDLVHKGKIHVVDGDIVLSDPPTTKKATTTDLKVAATLGKNTRKLGEDAEWAFNCFWSRYPRRTGKGAARKAFAAAVAAGTPASNIIEAAESYAARCETLQKEPQFIPHPATWLNQERWEDDEEQAPRVRSKVDDAMRSGMDLVNFYQQQEAIPFEPPKELGW